MTFRTYATTVLLTLALLLTPGCERSSSTTRPADTAAPAPPGFSLTDYVRHPPTTQPVPETTLRIVSGAPNTTEICCALGLRNNLVGRTRYCTYPPAIENVTSIGDLYNLSVEVLLERRSDVILVAGASRSISERLDELGLHYIALPDVSLEDLFASIEQMGARTDRSALAATLIKRIRADMANVRGRYADVPSQRVLLVNGTLSDPPKPVQVAGPGSFYDDLLAIAGHTNVAEVLGRPFGQLSLEAIAQADPDVIIELAPAARKRPGGDADARQAWAKIGPLRAVETEHVHVLIGAQHFVLGPRIAMTFEALCDKIAGRHHD